MQSNSPAAAGRIENAGSGRNKFERAIDETHFRGVLAQVHLLVGLCGLLVVFDAPAIADRSFKFCHVGRVDRA